MCDTDALFIRSLGTGSSSAAIGGVVFTASRETDEPNDIFQD